MQGCRRCCNRPQSSSTPRASPDDDDGDGDGIDGDGDGDGDGEEYVLCVHRKILAGRPNVAIVAQDDCFLHLAINDEDDGDDIKDYGGEDEEAEVDGNDDQEQLQQDYLHLLCSKKLIINVLLPRHFPP